MSFSYQSGILLLILCGSIVSNAKIIVSYDKEYNDPFDVSLSGTTMIGSIKAEEYVMPNVIQVYDKVDNDWTLTTSLYASSYGNVTYDYYYGEWSEYQIFDDTIVVGYPYTSLGFTFNTGSVVTYFRNSDSWS